MDVRGARAPTWAQSAKKLKLALDTFGSDGRRFARARSSIAARSALTAC